MRVQSLLDGSDPEWGHMMLVAQQSVILLAIVAFTISTMPDLPEWLDNMLDVVNMFVLVIFASEYLRRLWAALSRLGYMFSLWGIIDLLSFLPTMLIASTQSQGVRALRLLQLVRIAKVGRYSRALLRLARALNEVRSELTLGLFLAGLVLYVAASGIWIFERSAQPELFGSIFDCLWWAIVTMSTVGYGDAYPITAGGRIFTALVLVVGLAVIALPTALISAALVRSEFEEHDDDTR
ncbi:voltage-gated potassium channel [Monaibacterium marinum]|uniref:Voltage-gated potassium channel n=1 Tax=Pontivivens marinum TaxID=1690039 RepID=A0A2C9CTD5_9RHOB|nr:voltage-gated potassium channel [Monaibacterium marinum]